MLIEQKGVGIKNRIVKRLDPLAAYGAISSQTTSVATLTSVITNNGASNIVFLISDEKLNANAIHESDPLRHYERSSLRV